MSIVTRRHFLLATAASPLLSNASGPEKSAIAWQGKLETIRTSHALPGLGAAIVTPSGCQSLAVTGVRKKGSDIRITRDDMWHLGSNTKAMTSTLAAIAVEEGRLRWDSTLGEVFPRQKDLKKSPLAVATLTQLLSHWSGLPPNAMWGLFALGTRADLRSQRASVLELAARTSGLPQPGTKHEYSNFGYVLAGHMLEEVWNTPWEELMQRRLFKPLGITRAGFGGLGTPGKIDQPWPHDSKGKPMPNNGPEIDNAAVLGPAGTVHMSLHDWAKFVAEHLAGRAGKSKLLKNTASHTHLHTATQMGEPYAYGWLAVDRPWGGKVLTHAGSNTMNYSVAWLAPEKGFAVLACTNTGQKNAAKALDEVASIFIQQHLKGS